MTINRNVFDGMIVFREVVETGGFTVAARKLGHSGSYVSKEIASLEDRLGARLLNRTTRTLSLTEIGQIYFEQAQQIIDEARDAQSRVLSVKNKPFGLLRISVPVSFSQIYLNNWLPDFLNAYPDVRFQIEISDRRVDIITEGFDLVVRAGQLDDANLIAKRLMTSRLLTLAAPSYLKAHGTPLAPEDLKDHSLIDFSLRQISGTWNYRDRNGKPITISISPRIVCDSSETETVLASSGVGITRLPSLVCQKELLSGELVPILEAYEEPSIGLFALYPSRSHLSAKVRAFVDFLDEKFQTLGQCPPTSP